jgi:hypothetical protein
MSAEYIGYSWASEAVEGTPELRRLCYPSPMRRDLSFRRLALVVALDVGVVLVIYTVAALLGYPPPLWATALLAGWASW